MEKKIALDESFYGNADFITEPGRRAAKAACVVTDVSCPLNNKPCSTSDFSCSIVDVCKYSPCSDTPCKDNPCSDSPCSDSPCSDCSDTPAPTTYGSITSITATSDSITIRYTSIPKAVWYQVHYRKTSATATTPIANGSSLTCTITGLSPDTEYVVNYRGATATAFGPFMPTGRTIRTDPLVVRPDNWDWGYTVEPGARLPTAREWDDFCTCINDFRDYKGLSAYSFTWAYPGPTTLTAAMVNQTITAIKAMSPPTAPPSSAVKNVTKLSADLLNRLAASLNSIR